SITRVELLDEFGKCRAGRIIAFLGGSCGNAEALRKSLPKGRAFLYSASEGQEELEPPVRKGKVQHSFAVQVVLEGLQGKAANKRGEVTLDGLAEYARKNIDGLLKAYDPRLSKGGVYEKYGFAPQLIANMPGGSPVLVKRK